MWLRLGDEEDLHKDPDPRPFFDLRGREMADFFDEVDERLKQFYVDRGMPSKDSLPCFIKTGATRALQHSDALRPSRSL
jgi:hypothetical protein